MYNYLSKLKSSGFEPAVIYDIGACSTEWAAMAHHFWPNSKIILFDACDRWRDTYEKTGLDYHIGVLSSRDSEIVKFYESETAYTGNSYYREIGTNNFPPDVYSMKQTYCLDTVVKNKNYPKPNFVKIDVQGAETDVINGGVETLKSADRLIVEMQHTEYNEGAPKVGATLPFIESLGWECTDPLFHNNGPDGDYGFKRVVL